MDQQNRLSEISHILAEWFSLAGWLAGFLFGLNYADCNASRVQSVDSKDSKLASNMLINSQYTVASEIDS